MVASISKAQRLRREASLKEADSKTAARCTGEADSARHNERKPWMRKILIMDCPGPGETRSRTRSSVLNAVEHGGEQWEGAERRYYFLPSKRSFMILVLGSHA